MRLTVGDIARALGLTTEAIRYYVDEGLIHPIVLAIVLYLVAGFMFA